MGQNTVSEEEISRRLGCRTILGQEVNRGQEGPIREVFVEQ